MADIFDVVADSTRRDILQVLLTRHNQSSNVGRPGNTGLPGDAVGELNVSDIVGALGLSQPTVSKHLKVLREAGLVAVRERGQHRYYRLDYAPLETIEDWLIPFLSIDFDATAELGEDVDAGLKDEQRAFAAKIGKAFADTSFQMTHAVRDATARKRRRSD